MLKADTLTSAYLNGKTEIAVPEERRKGNGQFITIKGASGNNLRNVDVTFPLGTLICVTGVSGSGKSSLINRTLQRFSASISIVPWKIRCLTNQSKG